MNDDDLILLVLTFTIPVPIFVVNIFNNGNIGIICLSGIAIAHYIIYAIYHAIWPTEEDIKAIELYQLKQEAQR